MMHPPKKFKEMISGNPYGAPLIDLGTSTLTGIRSSAGFPIQKDNAYTHPIYQTIVLEPQECKDLGSDFIGTGLLYTPLHNNTFQDGFGVEWQQDEGNIIPVRHPLENAGLEEIRAFSKPQGQLQVQQIKPEMSENNPVIASAPSPGLLEMCFALRSPWKFLEDIIERPYLATALLEWSVESIINSYEYLLTSLEKPPDIIIYSDDLGYQGGMYLSPSEFRTYILPYFRILMTHLRKLSPAEVCYHSCGAIRPILPDLAGLGIRFFNLDTYAKGMDVIKLRNLLPSSIILHGSNDLCALGEAVVHQDKASIAYLITELAQSAPVIAGPLDSLSSAREVLAAEYGAIFIKQISDENFAKIRRFGPVRSIIAEALKNTLVLGVKGGNDYEGITPRS